MRKKFARILMVITLSVSILRLGEIYTFAVTAPVTPQISGQATYNSATVTFRSPTKVSGYEVSMSLRSKENYKVVYLGSKTSTTIKALVVGTPITIKVRSYVSKGSTKTYSAYASLNLSPSFSAVVLKGKTLKGTNTLSWAKVAGASSYEISSASSYSGTYKVISAVNTTTYASKLGLKTSTYYKVRAYTTVNKVKVYGPSSNVVYLKS
jgi:hypothetical protein